MPSGWKHAGRDVKAGVRNVLDRKKNTEQKKKSN